MHMLINIFLMFEEVEIDGWCVLYYDVQFICVTLSWSSLKTNLIHLLIDLYHF
jgi:hypothetical protein